MNWKHRSNEKEELDDLNISGTTLIQSLDELSWVHKYLGGHWITIQTIRKAIKDLPVKSGYVVRILDAGCGGGDSLRTIARWAEKKGFEVELWGVDGNAGTVKYARERSNEFSNIHFQQADFLSDNFRWEGYDIVMFSLVLHHFEDKDIVQILHNCLESGVQLICINDLHRHPVAHKLFSILTLIIGFSRISREDGLLSIRRAFKRNELKKLLNQSGYRDHHIQWQWAFRYSVVAKPLK